MLTVRIAVCAAVAVGCGGPTSAAKKPACPTGQVRVVDAEQLRAVSACKTLDGDLVIDGAALRDIDALAGLERITGSLTVGPTLRLSSLGGLRDLRSVTRDVDVRSNLGLAGVFLGNLVDVGGSLNIDRNTSAATVSLQHLKTVGGNVEISGNKDLLRLDLSGLETVGGDLIVDDNRQLEDVVIGEVAVTGERTIETQSR